MGHLEKLPNLLKTAAESSEISSVIYQRFELVEVLDRHWKQERS